MPLFLDNSSNVTSSMRICFLVSLYSPLIRYDIRLES